MKAVKIPFIWSVIFSIFLFLLGFWEIALLNLGLLVFQIILKTFFDIDQDTVNLIVLVSIILFCFLGFVFFKTPEKEKRCEIESTSTNPYTGQQTTTCIKWFE